MERFREIYFYWLSLIREDLQSIFPRGKRDSANAFTRRSLLRLCLYFFFLCFLFNLFSPFFSQYPNDQIYRDAIPPGLIESPRESQREFQMDAPPESQVDPGASPSRGAKQPRAPHYETTEL